MAARWRGRGRPWKRRKWAGEERRHHSGVRAARASPNVLNGPFPRVGGVPSAEERAPLFPGWLRQQPREVETARQRRPGEGRDLSDKGARTRVWALFCAGAPLIRQLR